MSDTFDPTSQNSRSSWARSNWVRMRTLIYLRWMAVIGQSAAILMATQILDIQLRLDYCGMLIALSALYNIGATVLFPANKRLSQREAALTLFFDMAQLAALLFLTGGLTNPFAVMILAQAIISATVLSLRATIILAAITLVVTAFLMRYYIPLQDINGVLLETAPTLVVGMWAAISISVVFLSVYARRVSLETYSMSEALSATQFALEREQKLTTLGGVVAAAAHELGTPLATIKLASAELIEELADQPELRADAELIRSQAERCRDILTSMGNQGKQDRHVMTAPFSAVVLEAAEPHSDRGIEFIFRVQGSTDIHDAADEPDISRRSEIIHGLRNLVQNAVDFAIETIWIDLDWTDDKLIVRIGDDGRGYPPDILARIGDPFVTKRPAQVRQKRRPGYEGMGLGLFIAKTLLERTNAKLTFTNGSLRPLSKDTDPELALPPGAIVELIWDRTSIEIPRDRSRGPLGDNQTLVNS